MRIIKAAGFVALALVVASCAPDDRILPGERLPLRPDLAEADAAAATAPGAAPITLPAPTVTRDWTHKAGGPEHATTHPALGSALTRIWSVNIGQGNSRRHRITAEPVIADGRIYTLDSRALVTAVSPAGETLWQRDLTPAAERANDASGGGIAAAGGRVYVTTGFGTLSALDAATGGVIWTQDLDAPSTAPPAVAGGLVYAVSRDNRAWAVDIENGRVRWELPGTPSLTGRLGAAGPAISSDLAIFPFSSGELVAAFRQGGVRLWSSAVSGQRQGRAYAAVTDIAADPVISGNTVYAGNVSGRSVALSLGNGQRIWSANYGAIGPMQVAGGSVFLVSDQNQLVRLDAATGETVWETELPLFRRLRPTRRDAVFAHYGPRLAGGRLLVASDDNQIRAYSPETGALIGTTPLPAGASTGMAVVNRTLYVVTGNGQLHAFR